MGSILNIVKMNGQSFVLHFFRTRKRYEVKELSNSFFLNKQIQEYKKMYLRSRLSLAILMILSFPYQLIIWLKNRRRYSSTKNQHIKEQLALFDQSEAGKTLLEKLIQEEERKNDFLKQGRTSQSIEAKAREHYNQLAKDEVTNAVEDQTKYYDHLEASMKDMQTTSGFILSVLLGFPMHILLFIYSRPLVYYVVNRLFYTFIVIIGVTIIVFTLLHLSPSNPAQNIIGEQATTQQIENFNRLHGLDDPYLVQLFRTVKGVFTFDLGNSYVGNESVVTILFRRFPVTWDLTIFALIISIVIALPAGIYAALKTNTVFDHLFMLVALVGISIPSFWQGLVFILTFSIRLGWLPATYHVGNWTSLLMPAVVLGTGLMAALARMTRSSMLEVMHEDYILTARSKGLSQMRIIFRHAVLNALIPIITLIGLQFGGMLGGAAITEKVFNINGIGSFIVDRQFIPDTPAVMGGVIYVAITISLVNLLIDLLYNLLDPRIRSRIKSGS